MAAPFQTRISYTATLIFVQLDQCAQDKEMPKASPLACC
jgi:hypothetical protein